MNFDQPVPIGMNREPNQTLLYNNYEHYDESDEFTSPL